MAIANLQEKMLFFTRQKNRLMLEISNVQMQQLNSAKKTAEQQLEYNQELSELYYDPDCGYGSDTYNYMYEQITAEHEFELSKLNQWEMQLDVQKNNLETQLNEINTYETTWTKLLGSAVKNDFQYGNIGGK